MAWKKLEECMAEVEHFKKRVNQLLDFIEEMGLRDKFEKWGDKNIDYPDELTKRRLKRSRMFHLDGEKPIKTWNPVGGCKHHCYGDGCWAAHQAPRIPRYKDGFDHPKLFTKELTKRFGKGVVVFVSSMGDLFGWWVPKEWIFAVIEAMKQSPDAMFFLETKNPARYLEFIDYLPKNVILSTTIETNRNYNVSSAPSPEARYLAMKEIALLARFKIHISIEPIMDFGLDVLVKMMREINPFLVSVGYDNWNCHLPEPPLEKTMELIRQLEQFTKVERKTLREKGA